MILKLLLKMLFQEDSACKAQRSPLGMCQALDRGDDPNLAILEAHGADAPMASLYLQVWMDMK